MLILKDRPDQAGGAYAVQLARAVHQSAIDDGGWESADLMLPKAPPDQRIPFGGTQTEMEVIANYRDALKKLEKAHGDSHKGDG